MKAVGYIRVSGASQAKPEKISLENQEEEIKRYCAKRDWEYLETYEDAAKSGRFMEKRTELQRLLNDAKEGHFQAVVTWDISRFGRSLLDIKNNIETLRKLDIFLVAMNDGVDTSRSSKNDNLILNFLASIAEYEAETIRDRTHSIRLALLKKGEVFIGHPPYGYQWNKNEKRLDFHPVEAPIFQRIVNDYLKLQKPLHTIVAELNQEKAACRRKSSRWHTGTISVILRNDAYYTGFVYVEQDGQTFTFNCPRLLKKYEFEQIQERLSDAKSRSGRPSKAAEVFLLYRMLRCGACGARLSTHYGSRPKADGSVLLSYCCAWHEKPQRHLQGHPRCSFVKVPAKPAEAFVMEEFCRLIRGEVDEIFEDPETRLKEEKELKQQVQHLERKLTRRIAAVEELDVALENGLPGAKYAEKYNSLQLEINEIQIELSEAKERLESLGNREREKEEFRKFRVDNYARLHILSQQILNAPIDLKQRLLRGMIDGMVVIPADDFRNMKIPWRFNLPLLKDILPQLPPWGGPEGGGGSPRDIDKAIWNELAEQRNDKEKPIVKDTINCCVNESLHGPVRRHHPLPRLPWKVWGFSGHVRRG